MNDVSHPDALIPVPSLPLQDEDDFPLGYECAWPAFLSSAAGLPSPALRDTAR